MRCKVCKNKFEPKWFLQKTCFDPKCIIEWNEKVKANKWKKEKKELKEKLKTKGDYEKELQTALAIFINKYFLPFNFFSCQLVSMKALLYLLLFLFKTFLVDTCTNFVGCLLLCEVYSMNHIRFNFLI